MATDDSPKSRPSLPYDEKWPSEKLGNMSREEFRVWFAALTPEQRQEFKEALEEAGGEFPTEPAPTSQ